MAYASRQDLVDRFGSDEIDDLAPAGGERDIAAVLADADAEINAALAVAYDLPLASGTYPALRAIACDLARLRLYDDAVPAEAVLGRANRSRMRLQNIADGKAALVDSDGAVVSRRIESGPTLGARAADVQGALGREKLKGY